MNSDEEIYTRITDLTRTPGVRMTWGPRQCEPPMPFFVYERTNGGEVHADNAIHAALPRYKVTVYSAECDEELEQLFAEAVALFGPYVTQWDFDHEREAYVTSFDFTYHGRPKDEV